MDSNSSSFELRGPTQFNPDGDASTVSVRWKAWLEEFEMFADCKGLFNQDGTSDKVKIMRKQRRAMLLYCAGPRVREITKSLANFGDMENYTAAVDALNAHFVVTPNSTFQRHLFRKANQNANETVAQYVSRLRVLAEGCSYSELDTEIKDQVVSSCLSEDMRKKFLARGADLDLKKLLEIARDFEAVAIQCKEMAQGQTVNRVSEPSQVKTLDVRKAGGTKQVECYRCGKHGHISSDKNCPARGKTCHKCGKLGHFESKCRSKASVTTKHAEHHAARATRVANERASGSDEDAFAFACQSKLPKVSVIVGGVSTKFIADTGSEKNIVSQETWELFKRSKVKVVSNSRVTEAMPKIYAYACSSPLPVVGVFEAEISLHESNQSTVAEFVVISGMAESLLGYKTCQELGIIKLTCNTFSHDDEFKVKYPSLFDGVGLLKDHEVKLSIDPNVQPVIQAHASRRIPYGLRKKVEAEIDKLLSLDIIESVKDPARWISPVVIVPKPSGEIRLCVDMRRANEAVIRVRHPMPTFDELLLEMNGSTVFSKLDLKMGYHQLLLKPESREITTFATHHGVWRYKRLMFGISSAPETYQNVIQQTLSCLPGVVNMSDDIVVHAATKAEHDVRLNKVFQRLQESGLTLNKEKCIFSANEIEFLGHKLSSAGIEPGKAKVRAVVDAIEPKNAAEVYSFLGLVSYVSKFIPQVAYVSEPLRKLTRNGVKFEFGPEQKKAFRELKEKLADYKTLGYFDPKSEKTQVIADASPYGLGAVLVQVQNGTPRVIMYASRTLTGAERRYSQTEREGLALVWACERFSHYLLGMEFDIVTDHKPLVNIYSPRSKPNWRMERWVLRLQPFRYNVVYKTGKSNIADSLSRLMSDQVQAKFGKQDLEEFHSICAVCEYATPRALTTRQIERETHDDVELREVHDCVQSGDWSNYTGKKVYKAIQHELATVGKLILRGNRLVIPEKLRGQTVALAHEGHLGIVGTKSNLRTKVWWPGIDADAEKYCKSCHGCQLTNEFPNPEPIRSTKLPTGPWVDLAADYLGPLPNGDHILVVIDYYSRFYEYRVMKTITTQTTTAALDDMFFIHGLPISIKTDNGPQFRSCEFEQYCEAMGIIHQKVTPRWPQANGEVERQNQSLMKRIRIAFAESKDYKVELRKYVTAYRSVVHPATGKTPAELLYGRVIRTKLPTIAVHTCDDHDQAVRDRDSEAKGLSKLQKDEERGAVESSLEPGDHVLVLRDERSSKIETPFHPDPGRVIGKQGSMITVEHNGKQITRNSSRFKPVSFATPSENVVDEHNNTQQAVRPETDMSADSLNGHTPAMQDRMTDDRRTSNREKITTNPYQAGFD